MNALLREWRAIQRLMANVRVLRSGCWEWTGRKFRGYGKAKYLGHQYAHQMAWMLAYSKIPTGMCVCHSCDMPSCCNPDHLFLGTQADNQEDKVSKDRQAVGEQHGRAKVTDEVVDRIRMEAQTKSYEQIAKEVNLHPTQVSRIVRRLNWGHRI